MDPLLISGLGSLGQPRLGSIYDETGTKESGYADQGPYSCKNCIHKTASDEPFCIHPKVIGDPDLQNRLVMIDMRPAIKVCLEHGCCTYVRPPEKTGEEHETKDSDHGPHE
jgi:hypothetical protein